MDHDNQEDEKPSLASRESSISSDILDQKKGEFKRFSFKLAKFTLSNQD
jgi:hypothetical protein